MSCARVAVVSAVIAAFAIFSAGAAVNSPECIVPAKAGGGFDFTCKLVQQMLKGNRPASEAAVSLSYVPGGIGAVAFDRAVKEQLSDPGTLIAFSSGSLLNLVQGKFGPHRLDSVKWLAVVGTDYGIIAVRVGSRISSLADLQSELARGATRVVFGAGGTIGSQDWIKAALLVRAAGRDHKSMRFVSFEGGGEALAALRDGHVDVYAGDASEVRGLLSAKPQAIKVIAVLAERRLPGVMSQIPTAREQGIDLVWPTARGVYLGPGVSDADFRAWSASFDKAMAAPGFASILESSGMYPLSLTGPSVGEFVTKQAAHYRDLAKTLNLRVTAP